MNIKKEAIKKTEELLKLLKDKKTKVSSLDISQNLYAKNKQEIKININNCESCW